MTSILADLRLGVLVADSSVSDDDRMRSDRKTFRPVDKGRHAG